MPALALALAGCAAGGQDFVPPDPGPVATEYFNGEIVWKISFAPPALSQIGDSSPIGPDDGVVWPPRRPSPVQSPNVARPPAEWTLLSREDTGLLLQRRSVGVDPWRGKLSFGEEQPLFKIDYAAGTYREVKGDPEDEVQPNYRAEVTRQLKLRETAEQRVILGYLCTATIFPYVSRGATAKVWSTRALKINKTPLLFLEDNPGPLGILLASVRGVPLLIEMPGMYQVEATSITEKSVAPALLRSPAGVLRQVK